jgi:hypothetical protein
MDRIPHSKTLGVASRLYVIGLARRQDRRATMEKLAHAMGERKLISCDSTVEHIDAFVSSID